MKSNNHIPIRIIPRLDIKGPNLVKGIHLEGLRVLGKPENFAKYYYENGADELIYIDIVASLYNRNNIDDIISKTAKNIFIPLVVGGGIRTTDDIKRVLRCGADRVAINTAAIKKPEFVSVAANIFGSSTITISMEVSRQNGRYLCFTDNGREDTRIEAVGWAKTAEKLGAGEILLTSIDKEGTGDGFDLELIKTVSRAVSIPVIACGGAGKVADILEVIKKGGANAIAFSSILHYDFISKHKIKGNFMKEGNTDFLKSERSYTRILPVGIKEVKTYLSKQKVNCRY